MQVESSSITDIGYDPAHNRLRVRFRSGVEYRYDLVPASVHRAFVESGSKGRFFSREIRDRYPCRRLGIGAGLTVSSRAGREIPWRFLRETSV
jgi:hypothetical protein